MMYVHMHYRLGFPVFVASVPFRHHTAPQLLYLDADYSSMDPASFKEKEKEYVKITLHVSNESENLSKMESCLAVHTLQQVDAWSRQRDSQNIFAMVREHDDDKQKSGEGSECAPEYRVCSLAQAWELLDDLTDPLDIIYCVKDVHGSFQLGRETEKSTEQDDEVGYTPGWGVRNVLAFLAHALEKRDQKTDAERIVRVLCVQYKRPPRRNQDTSGAQLCFPLLTVAIPSQCLVPADDSSSSDMPKVVGWQANERGKPGPRVLDAAIVMDTRRIMEQVHNDELPL